MENFKNKTNNELLLDIKQMELDHEATKNMILKYYDILEAIEKRFEEAHTVLNKRLTGDNN
jgi:hypothetical protein